MVDANKAYEVENGFLVEDGPFYTGGAISPVGLDAPTNTVYTQHDATGITFWKKYGALTTEWRPYSAQDIRALDPEGGESNVQDQLNAAVKNIAIVVPFDKGGNAAKNTFLNNGEIASNVVGFPIGGMNPKIEAILIRQNDASEFAVEIYEHDGSTFGLLYTTDSLNGDRVLDVSDLSIPITPGLELACKIIDEGVNRPKVVIAYTADAT